MSVLMTSIYGKFQCIADRCRCSCCDELWDICIDDESFEKYRQMNLVHFEEYIETGQDGIHRMKKSKDGRCRYLTENGLCDLVVQYGPDILCATCNVFPRASAKGYGEIEKTLSNGCPAVLQLLYETPNPLTFVQTETMEEIVSRDTEESMKLLVCRNLLIDLLQISDLPLWIRMYLGYSFACKIEQTRSTNEIDEWIQKYNRVEYIIELCRELENISCDIYVQIEYMNKLTNAVNYKVKDGRSYKMYVEKVERNLNDRSEVRYDREWELFQPEWEKYGPFLENVLVNAVFKNCGKGKKKWFVMQFLNVIMEFGLIRYAVFLNWIDKDRCLTKDMIFDIVCHYARILEHINSQRLEDFFDELEEKGWINVGKVFLMIR